MGVRNLSFYLILMAGAAYIATQGLDLWDSGYIVGYSWRMAEGALPYRDFFYKGPPATLFLWSMVLKVVPVWGQYYLLKLINWLLFGWQIQLWLGGIERGLGWKIPNRNLIGWIGVVFSVQFFPMYPWPTTDGLLYCAIAFYLWTLCFKTYKINFYILWIGLFSIAAALTKQSFYAVPVAFLCATALRYPLRTVGYLLLSQLLGLGLFLVGLLSFTSWENFLSHTTGETTITDLIYSGAINYFISYQQLEILWVPLFCIALAWGIWVLKTRSGWEKSLQILALCFGIYGVIWAVVFSFQEGSRLLWLGIVLGMIALLGTKTNRHKASVLGLVLAVAWCAAISLGYPFPILMGTSLLVLLLWLLQTHFPSYMSLSQGILIIGIICGTAYQYQPYAERPLNELHYDLGTVSPKLAGIKTSKVHYEKWLELQKLHRQFRNKAQIIAPNMALFYYAMGIQNPLPADWLLNWEIHRDPKTLLEIASSKENVIFVEKSFVRGNEHFMPQKREDFSMVTDYIIRHFRLQQETKHFLIYNGTPLDAPLPQTSSPRTLP